MGTKLAHSSSYHPQSDGKIDIVNKCLEGYICFFAYDKQTQWVKWFPLKNGGTTHPSTLHQECPHLWNFMDIILQLSHDP